MENGAFEKKWEVFFFLVILFLVSFILIRAGLQKVRDVSPSVDNRSLLARALESRTFLKNEPVPLLNDEENAMPQGDSINEIVIREFNERSLVTHARRDKSIDSPSDSIKPEPIGDIVVFPEAMRLPPVKDKEAAQMVAAERLSDSDKGVTNKPVNPDVASQKIGDQNAIRVAIPFAHEWKKQKTQKGESRSVGETPESYSESRPNDMPVLIPNTETAAAKRAAESSPKTTPLAANKKNTLPQPAEATVEPAEKLNPFRNVSMEKTPASTKEPGKAQSKEPGLAHSGASVPVQASVKPDKGTASAVKTATVTEKTKDQAKDSPAKSSAPVMEKTPVAQEPTGLCDEVWLVSNPCGQTAGPTALSWQRLDCRQFVSSCYEEYQAGQASLPTVVFIHGNLTDMANAVDSGMYLKCRLEAIRRSLGIDTAFRLVIWKWNSEKTFVGVRKDSQYKAALADQDGQSLAEFLRNDKQSARTTLIGFSFGAKIIGSACNILATGEPQSYRAIFVSAATDYYDYAPCGCYAPGASCLDLLLNLYNPDDKALRFYPLLYGHGGVDALGTVPLGPGMVTPCLQGKTMSLSSVCCGNQHKFPAFMQCIPDQTLSEIVFGR